MKVLSTRKVTMITILSVVALLALVTSVYAVYDYWETNQIRTSNMYLTITSEDGSSRRGLIAGGRGIGIDTSYTSANNQLLDLGGGTNLWVKNDIKAGDRIWALGDLWSNSNLAIFGNAYIGQIEPTDPGYEGGEILLRPGFGDDSGWVIDNYYGTFRLHHSGQTFFGVTPEGNVYLKLATSPGTPSWQDCNGADDVGRMRVDTQNTNLYVCTKSGWVTK
jgi:hypothetical protein